MEETPTTNHTEQPTGRFVRRTELGRVMLAGGTDIDGPHPLADFMPNPVEAAQTDEDMEAEWAAMAPHDRVTELGLDEDHSATMMLRRRILMPPLPQQPEQTRR